jgi:hypothetical protein
MKKILLALSLTLSFSAVMAKSDRAENSFEGQNTFLLQKAPANSGIHQQLNSSNFDQCTRTCLQNFRSCIATAQGSGEWWYCELTYERCQARCW